MDASERVLNLPLLRWKRTLAHEHAGATQSSDCSDEELLERIQNRNDEALLTLFHRYNRLAFSVGYRILRDDGEAEDFVQEVFLRLCSENHSFEQHKGLGKDLDAPDDLPSCPRSAGIPPSASLLPWYRRSRRHECCCWREQPRA